jgi:hypothetical protein
MEDGNTIAEQYEALPQDVKNVLDKYSECENDYDSCAKLQEELETIGWTISYYLDAEPYDLRRVIKKGQDYTYDEIYEGYAETKGLDERDYELTSEGEFIVGHNILKLEHKTKDEIMTFILTGTRGGQGIFECVYNSNEIVGLP